MAVGTGFGFDLSQLDAELKRADEALKTLGKTGKASAKQLDEAFALAKNGNIQDFISVIDRLSNSLGKKGYNHAANMVREIATETTGAIDRVNRFATLMQTITDGGRSTVKNGAIESLKYQIDEALARLGELNNKLQFYTKGEGAKAVNANVVDTTALQEEANQLRVNIELLQRRLEHEQALASLKQRSGAIENQQALNTSWQKMDELRTKELQQQSTNAKKANKVYEQAYNERYQMYAMMLDKANEADEERRRKQAQAQAQTYEGAIRTSGSAKTLAQEIQAVKNLEAARAKLSKTDEEYDKKLANINGRIKQHNKNIDKATRGARELSKEHQSLGQAAGALGKVLASAFSIQAIRGYITEIIRVRGEFELQQRALQAILQNKEKADEIWQKTVDLAVKSPFRIKDLVTYTKQLAAYRVESDKLYETNKMLADVSAGLGVDMDRLILAFGQVKAANFLRGTELRQFTEAGIPMLEELAKLYSDIEGKAVTTGEVFERISKRMVLFEDVEKVLQKMTSAGGVFYRMQEIQSETLQGQISNLKDSIDIFLNAIGKEHEGTIKNSIKLVKLLLDNYERLLPIIRALVATFALYKVNTFNVSKRTKELIDSMKLLGVETKGLGGIFTTLKVNMKQFGKQMASLADSMASNYWMIVIALIAKTAIEVGKLVNKYRDVNKSFQQMIDTQRSLEAKYLKAQTLEGEIEALKELIEYAEKEYSLDIKVNLKKPTREELYDAYHDARQQMLEINAFGKKFQDTIVSLSAMDQFDFLGWFSLISLPDTLVDFFETDLKEVSDSYEDLNTLLLNRHNSTIVALRNNWGNLSEEQQQAFGNLAEDIRENEDTIDYFNRLRESYTTLEDAIMDSSDTVGEKISALMLRFKLKAYDRDLKEAEHELDIFKKTIDKQVSGLSDEDKTIYLNAAINKAKFDREWSDFTELLIRKYLSKEYTINLVPQVSNATPVLEKWAVDVKDAITKVNNKIKAGNPEIDDKELFPLPQIGQTQKAYLALANDVIAIAEKTYNKGQKIESESAVKRTEALKPYADEVRRILNIYKEGLSKEDIFSNKLRTIKEIYEEYKKLLSLVNKESAKEGALAKFGDAFKSAFSKTPEEMGFDLFSEEGVKAAYDYLISQAPDAKAKIQAELARGEVVWDVRLKDEEETNKKLFNKIQNQLDQYKLSLDIKKLNIPTDLAEYMFGVKSIDLPSIRDYVDKELKGVESMEGYEDRVAKLKEFLAQINKIEQEERVERMKKYFEYTRASIGERAKIKVEEMRKLQDIEETFNKTMSEAKTEEDRKRIFEEKKLAKKSARQDALDKMKKLDWEDFKVSDTFINLFNDLDNVSSDLIKDAITKIQTFKKEWTNMPIESAKEMALKLKELELALLDTNRPLKDNQTLWEKLGDEMDKRDIDGRVRDPRAQARLKEAITSENRGYEAEIEMSNKRITALQTINQLKSKGNEKDLASLGYTKEYIETIGLTEDVFKNNVKANQDLINDEKNHIKLTNDKIAANRGILNTQVQISKNAQELSDAIATGQKLANDLYDSFKGLSEALGGGDGPEAIFADMGASMANTVLDTVMLIVQMNAATIAAQGLGAAMRSASGIIGLIVMGIQLVVAGITAIVKANDNKIVDQLEEQAAIIERQRDLYEQIEEKVEKAYNVDQLRQYNKEMTRSIELEIQALGASIALERSRKNADEDQIKQYEEEMAEARKRLVESTKEMMEEMGGIFDLTDFTSGFVDAWWDAMDEGKRGLDALGEHFDETMKDMVKKQALYKGAQEIMTQVQNAINKSLEGDFTINEYEWQDIMDAAKKANVNLDEFLKGWYDMFGAMSDGAGGSLSGLTKGVQGITEDTAQIIEAYLNSIRGYVSEQVTHTKNIYRILERVSSRDGTSAIQVRMIS